MKRTKEDSFIYKKLEKIFKGAANHRRLEILFLLQKTPGLSVDQIATQTEVAFVTIASHLQKLNHSGLISKNYVGRTVIHHLTKRGKDIMTLCRML